MKTSTDPACFPSPVVQQKLGKRVKNIRELVRDVVGSAPYEKRLMELLKVGRDKRALKLAKRKVRLHAVYRVSRVSERLLRLRESSSRARACGHVHGWPARARHASPRRSNRPSADRHASSAPRSCPSPRVGRAEAPR